MSAWETETCLFYFLSPITKETQVRERDDDDTLPPLEGKNHHKAHSLPSPILTRTLQLSLLFPRPKLLPASEGSPLASIPQLVDPYSPVISQFKYHFRGMGEAPGWLSRVSLQLLAFAQVTISGWWDRASHWAPHSVSVGLGFSLPLPLPLPCLSNK